MIGIFKVNTIQDGGLFIDLYLKQILNENGMPAECFAFHSENEPLSDYVNIKCRYKKLLETVRKIHETIVTHRITVSYTNQFATLLYLVFVRRVLGVKFAIIAKVDGYTIRKGMKRYLHGIYDLFHNAALRLCDFIIFENKRAKRSWRRKDCAVIYSPAAGFRNSDIEKVTITAPQIAGTGLNVLFVGRYSEEKGFRSLACLADNNPDIMFTAVGGHDAELAWKKNIIQPGYLSIDGVISCYKAADLLLVPSLDDAFPGVIREFAYFNKPIIASDVGAISEYKTELDMDIELCRPDIDRMNEKITIFRNKAGRNGNRAVYDRYFDPGNKEIQEKYLRIFRRYQSG